VESEAGSEDDAVSIGSIYDLESSSNIHIAVRRIKRVDQVDKALPADEQTYFRQRMYVETARDRVSHPVNLCLGGFGRKSKSQHILLR